MSNLGISLEKYFWSEDDENILKNNYSTMYGRVNDLVELFDNKYSYSSITSKARKLGLKTRDFWSEEELKIIYDNYEKCTVDEMTKLLPSRNRNSIISKAISLGLKNKLTTDIRFSDSDKTFIFENYNSMTDKEISEKIGRTRNSINDYRFRNGLLKTYEKSSYNDLSEYVRRNNIEWKQKSIQECNYKCILTNQRFDHVHHIYGLNLILNETLDKLNIEIKPSIDDYSKEELQLILDCFREKQNTYPLGVCLTKEIHMKFHEIYGYGNNTIEQWNEFVSDFKSGKYKDVA